jgi:hypothetical protein
MVNGLFYNILIITVLHCSQGLLDFFEIELGGVDSRGLVGDSERGAIEGESTDKLVVTCQRMLALQDVDLDGSWLSLMVKKTSDFFVRTVVLSSK